MKVTDRIELIDGTMAHAYVFDSDEGQILFDTGTKGSGRKIVEYFKRNGGKPAYVLLTHYHMDHIGGLPLIRSEFKPTIFINSKDMKVVTGEISMPRPPNRLVSMMMGHSKVTPVSEVNDLGSLNISGIKVIETPGHTPGSTSYAIESQKAIVVGDALVNSRGHAKVSKAFSLDFATATRSLDMLKKMKGYKALPGHGNPLDL